MAQKKRIEDIQKGRTNLFSLRWQDCEPASVKLDGKPSKLNTRVDFGDIPEFALSLIDGDNEGAVREPLLGYMGENGKFQITNGERRWKGAAWLEKNKGIKILLPCVREPRDHDDTDRNLDLLRTNNGKPLDMLEKAEAMQRLLAANLSPKAIATEAGCSTTHVVDCLALLNLAPEVMEALRSGEIKPTLAVDLSREVPDKEKQADILKKGREKAAAQKRSRPESAEGPRKKKKITAKHLPISTGKKAQAEKKKKSEARSQKSETPALPLTGTSFSGPRTRRPVGLARPSGRDKTLDMLEDLLEAAPRSECENTERFDTLAMLIDYAGGHIGMSKATKFILGM